MAVVDDAGLICTPKVPIKPLVSILNPNYKPPINPVSDDHLYVRPVIKPVTMYANTESVMGLALHKALVRTIATGNSYCWQDKNQNTKTG